MSGHQSDEMVEQVQALKIRPTYEELEAKLTDYKAQLKESEKRNGELDNQNREYAATIADQENENESLKAEAALYEKDLGIETLEDKIAYLAQPDSNDIASKHNNTDEIIEDVAIEDI